MKRTLLHHGLLSLLVDESAELAFVAVGELGEVELALERIHSRDS